MGLNDLEDPPQGPQQGEEDVPVDAGEEADLEVDDDGGAEVNLPLEPPPGTPPESFNLAAEYRKTPEGLAFLERLSQQVLEHFDEDWKSAEGHRETRAVIHKLFTGEIDEKDFPFEDCANVHWPLMLESLLRLHARGMAELFPQDGRICRPIGTDAMDTERQDRLALHAEYQFRSEMPDFIPNQDAGLLECWLTGSVFYHSYRDQERRRNCHDYLTCDDFVMPYLWKSTDPSLSDVPRKTRILRKYRYELEAWARDGYYTGLDELLEDTPTASAETERTPAKEVSDQHEGREPEPNDDQAPYRFLEYHGWIALPEEPARQRPIVATVEKETGTVIGLFRREEVAWKEKQRFELEQQAYAQYQAEQSAYADQIDNRQTLEAMLADPNLDPQAAQALQQQLGSMQMKPPAEVPAPIPPKATTIEYFTRAICIPNPVGSYGIGIGHLVMGFNITADTVTNQFLDAATLANTVTAIVAEAAQLSSGETDITPGSTITSKLPPEQLQQAIKIVQFPAANHQMMEVAALCKEFAVGVSSAPDVYSGEPGKANETWRGISTRVEQANKQITMLMLRYMAALTHLFKKNARLNALFLSDAEYFAVVDPEKRVMVGKNIGRQDYAEDFDIQFTADPRLVSQQQRVAEADANLQRIMSLLPALAEKGPKLLYRALVSLFRALRQPEMLEALGPEPEPPPPPQPKPSMEENAGFLRGQDSPVLPEDDDGTHLPDHMGFRASEEGGFLDPKQVQMLEQHIRAHVAQAMLKRAAAMQGGMNGQAIPGAGPGGPPDMAQPAGNQGLPS